MKIEDYNSVVRKANYIDYEVYCKIRQIALHAGMVNYTAEFITKSTNNVYIIKVTGDGRSDESNLRSTLDAKWLGVVGQSKFSSIILDGLHSTRYYADNKKEIDKIHNILQEIHKGNGGIVENTIAINSLGSSTIWHRVVINGSVKSTSWESLDSSEYDASKNVEFTTKEFERWNMFGGIPIELPKPVLNPEVYQDLLKEMGGIYKEIMNGAVGLSVDSLTVYEAIGRMNNLRAKI